MVLLYITKNPDCGTESSSNKTEDPQVLCGEYGIQSPST